MFICLLIWLPSTEAPLLQFLFGASHHRPFSVSVQLSVHLYVAHRTGWQQGGYILRFLLLHLTAGCVLSSSTQAGNEAAAFCGLRAVAKVVAVEPDEPHVQAAKGAVRQARAAGKALSKLPTLLGPNRN